MSRKKELANSKTVLRGNLTRVSSEITLSSLMKVASLSTDSAAVQAKASSALVLSRRPLKALFFSNLTSNSQTASKFSLTSRVKKIEVLRGQTPEEVIKEKCGN